jgi:hypothetical protein
MNRPLNKDENLGSKILNQCDPVTGDTKLCVFQKATKPTYPDFSRNDVFSLIIDQESAGKTFFKKHDVRNFFLFRRFFQFQNFFSALQFKSRQRMP